MIFFKTLTNQFTKLTQIKPSFSALGTEALLTEFLVVQMV